MFMQKRCRPDTWYCLTPQNRESGFIHAIKYVDKRQYVGVFFRSDRTRGFRLILLLIQG